MKALVLMTFTSLADAPPESWRSPLLLLLIAKDCLLTLVKSRLALGSPGCSWPCRKWPNTQENGCCLPPSDHIQSKILFQTKQDQERGMNGPASLLHSWHWVLFWAIIVFFMLFLYLHLKQWNLAWLDARDKLVDRFEQLSGVWFHTVFVFASDMYE